LFVLDRLPFNVLLMKTIFAKIIVFLLLLLSFHLIKAQCIADAGDDAGICVLDNMPPFYLGGSPTASGGTPPYTYSWSCTVNVFDLFNVHASYFLNDTTIANPKLKAVFWREVTFYLTVTDSLGASCKDSITLKFSTWTMNLEWKFAKIHRGDSARLYTGLGGGIPPYTYLWTPFTGLSDPTDLTTWAKPMVTTRYVLTIIDSIGCQVFDEFDVIVIPVGITAIDGRDLLMNIYPNPLTQQSVIKIYDPELIGAEIIFYDALGRLHKRLRLDNTETELKREEFNTGVYYYWLMDHQTYIGSGMLLVN